MVTVLLTFGFAFAWLEIIFDQESFRLFQIPKALLRVLTGDTWAHMWYIYCLIGIYVLLPMYKIIAEKASDEQIQYINSFEEDKDSNFGKARTYSLNQRQA